MVEWSEKWEQWCVQDAHASCLSHTDHIQGIDADTDAAVVPAEAGDP
jgi:hypothetical protein